MPDMNRIKELLKKDIKVADIVQYVKENKKNVTIAGIILVLVIAGFGVYKSGLLQQQTEESNTPVVTQQPGSDDKNTSEQVFTYLPETKRTIKDLPAARDPFAGAMVLKGIITGGDGKNIAIVEIGNASYIAEEGVELTSGLMVEKVNADSLVLKSDQEKLVIRFNKAVQADRIEQETKKNEQTEDKQQQAKEGDQ